MEISNKNGMKEIFTPYIRKNGRIIRPKNARFFHFWVPAGQAGTTVHQQCSLLDKDEE